MGFSYKQRTLRSQHTDIQMCTPPPLTHTPHTHTPRTHHTSHTHLASCLHFTLCHGPFCQGTGQLPCTGKWAALPCVTSGKGLSIGCQFSILLGTYYPRNTPSPLAQSVLGLPWLTIKASQASCLWFLRGGVATDVIFSRTCFLSIPEIG